MQHPLMALINNSLFRWFFINRGPPTSVSKYHKKRLKLNTLFFYTKNKKWCLNHIDRLASYCLGDIVIFLVYFWRWFYTFFLIQTKEHRSVSVAIFCSIIQKYVQIVLLVHNRYFLQKFLDLRPVGSYNREIF